MSEIKKNDSVIYSCPMCLNTLNDVTIFPDEDGIFAVPTFGFTAVCFADASAWLVADMFLVPCYIYCLRKLKARANLK